MNGSKLEKQMTVFLGHVKKSGATEDEIATIIKTIGLIRKYLPFRKQN